MAYTIDTSKAAFTIEDKLFPYDPKSCSNSLHELKSLKFEAE